MNKGTWITFKRAVKMHFKPSYGFTPIAITWGKTNEINKFGQVEPSYVVHKRLYIFGIKVAQWQTSNPE